MTGSLISGPSKDRVGMLIVNGLGDIFKIVYSVVPFVAVFVVDRSISRLSDESKHDESVEQKPVTYAIRVDRHPEVSPLIAGIRSYRLFSFRSNLTSVADQIVRESWNRLPFNLHIPIVVPIEAVAQ